MSKTQILINNGNGIIPFKINNEKLLKPFSTLKIDSQVYLSKKGSNFVGLAVCNQDLAGFNDRLWCKVIFRP